MRRLIAVIGIAAALATGCGAQTADQQPEGSSSRHNTAGAAESERSDPPKKTEQRIVPLNGDIAEIVWSLGLGDRVVGVDVSATYPKEAANHPNKIGYQRRLSAEGILALDPTIAIGTDEAGPPTVITQLRDAGVRVEILEFEKTPAGVPDKIRAVADALGVPDEGKQLAATVQDEITAARRLAEQATSKPTVAFVYARGKDTLMLGGRGSRADGMIRAAGAIDAGVRAGVNGFVQLTPEALAKGAPDVLLLLDGGLKSLGGEAGLRKIPGVAQTPAAKNDRILHYDGQLLLGLGPRTGTMLTTLIHDLHPELGP